jgi:hypothetical protein
MKMLTNIKTDQIYEMKKLDNTNTSNICDKNVLKN